MAATRRGFLGLLGGTAVAGPKLAQSLAGEVAGGMPAMAPMGFAMSAIGGEGEWKAKRIAELTKWITLGRPEAANERRQHLHYQLEARERFRLDGLRSVSPVQRHAMLVAGNMERRERIQKFEWELELSHLTGGIL